MKLRHFFPCLLLAGMSVTMVSCSEEATLPQGQGRNVTMTVNISRVGDNTRSILTEAEGDLKCTWEATDLILVVDGSGKKLGVLSLQGEAGLETATFTGTITTDAVGDTDVNFLYLGSKTAEELNALASPVVLDYSSQDGTLAWLSANDFFSGSENVNIVNSYVSVESVSLSRQISFGKFDMKLPEGVTYNGEAITVSGTGLNTKASISLSDGKTVFSEEGSITVTRPEGETDTEFYLTVLPSIITPTFSVTIGDKTYSSTLGQREWKASEFVRKSGTYEGIALDMTTKDPDENDPYEGYENEDPRNPLHKFAKYNLVRVGERGSLENGFASSETENGALYQWGRNYGYMDRSGTYYSNGITISGDFTNYFDAFGDYTWIDNYGYLSTSESSNYSRLHDYYVYTRENYYWTSGTGARGNTIGGTWISIDNFYGYDNVEVLKSNPDKFFINYSEGTEDYWLNGFTGDGSTWTARAKACGYETENPCPMGWRMPTEADFMEICPSSMPSYAGDLSTLITQKVTPELRETNTGVKYVIRWLNYTDYMSIQAIVVADSFKENDIAAIIWDNNPEVVERKFPFTGNIVSYAAKDTRLSASRWNNGVGQTVMLVIPYTLGTLNQESKTSVFNYTLFTPNKNYGSAVGGYWVGDSKKTFQFFDRSKGDGKGSSSIDIRTTGAQAAYAIRPVMDK